VPRWRCARNSVRTLPCCWKPGETIQSVVPAQTVSQYFALISIWIIVFKNAYRNIVVTDRRILICSSGRFRLSPVKAVLSEYPRQLKIGPAHGPWYRCDAFGDKLYINKRFLKTSWRPTRGHRDDLRQPIR
jgi:hypothetical protein